MDGNFLLRGGRGGQRPGAVVDKYGMREVALGPLVMDGGKWVQAETRVGIHR